MGADSLVRVAGRIAPALRGAAGNKIGAHFPTLAIAAAGLFVILALTHIPSIVRDIAAAQGREDTLRRPLGLWLRDHVGSDERVLLEPIGYAGYYSGRRILDMVGLVSPEVLPYYHTPHALSGIVSGLGPEWLCLRVLERDLLHEQDPTLPEPKYQFVQSFPSKSDPAFVLYHLRSAEESIATSGRRTRN